MCCEIRMLLPHHRYNFKAQSALHVSLHNTLPQYLVLLISIEVTDKAIGYEKLFIPL